MVWKYCKKDLEVLVSTEARKTILVNFVANQFSKEDFSLVITPEGTEAGYRNGEKDSITWLWQLKFL